MLESDGDLFALRLGIFVILRGLEREHYIAIGGYNIMEDKRVNDGIETSLNFLRLV